MELNLDHPDDFDLVQSWRFQPPADDGPLLRQELERVGGSYSVLTHSEWTLAVADWLGGRG